MGKKRGNKKKQTTDDKHLRKAPKLPPVRTGAKHHTAAPPGRRGR